MFVSTALRSFSKSMKSIPSLTLLLVTRLGRGLGRLPPRAVLRVPFDRLLQARFEVGVPRRPAELGAQFGRVDRVTAVVARTVLDPIERVFRLTHHLQDHAQHGDVVPLAVGADQVRLADTALGENRPHARAVVLGMDPVAHVLALAVQLRTLPVQDVRDLARDELLHMLVRTVVIRAVRDRGVDAVRARPRAHQHVGRGLRARVRAGRMVGRMLRELRRIVQGEVAVHLVRAHVVVADPVLPDCLEQAERALDVRFQERLRVRDRIVVMGLGRVVHDRVVARHDPVEQLGVADVAVHELDTILRQARDILDVARIGQGIQHGHMHVRMVVDHVMHEIRPDETTATGHNDVLGNKRLFSHTIDSTACPTPLLSRIKCMATHPYLLGHNANYYLTPRPISLSHSNYLSASSVETTGFLSFKYALASFMKLAAIITITAPIGNAATMLTD